MQGKIALAYAVISLVWGSTYLAIRIGVRHLPPFLFGGLRFLTAGALLAGLALLLGQRLPRRASEWGDAVVIGLSLLFAGNGLLIWAEQFVESSTAAIFIVTVALWMALFDAVIPGSRARVTWSQVAGLLAGFSGTVFLVGGDFAGLRHTDLRGPLALAASPVCWALGSVYAQRRKMHSGPYMSAALQMIFAGCAFLLTGFVSGEVLGRQVSPAGFLAVAYLIVFGSIIAYSSYIYLLGRASTTLVGTAAYVNTVVAVLLGWIVLGEAITTRKVVSVVVVLGAVLWVQLARRAPTGPPQAAGEGGVGVRER